MRHVLIALCLLCAAILPATAEPVQGVPPPTLQQVLAEFNAGRGALYTGPREYEGVCERGRYGKVCADFLDGGFGVKFRMPTDNLFTLDRAVTGRGR